MYGWELLAPALSANDLVPAQPHVKLASPPTIGSLHSASQSYDQNHPASSPERRHRRLQRGRRTGLHLG